MKQWVYYLLSFVLCILGINQTLAQDKGHWTITVLSAVNKAPIAKATVTLNNVASYQTSTNGHFETETNIGKNIHLYVSCVGYQSVHKHLAIRSAMQHDTVLLQNEIFELKEIDVHAHIGKKIALTTSNSLSKDDLEKTAGENLANQLANIQGVSTLKSGTTIAKPIINGMHSNRVLILNNGIRQEGQQWGAEHAPEIDPFVAKSITVIKGAESVRYGSDAIGGVVLVEPPSLPIADVWHGEIDAIGESNGKKQAYSATLQGNLPNSQQWGWRVQSSYTRSGDLKTPNYYLSNSGVQALNFSGEIGYSKKYSKSSIYFSHFDNEIGILRAANIGNQQDLLARIASGKPLITYPYSNSIDAPKQKITHDLIKLQSQILLNEKNKIEIQYAWQRNHRQEYDIRRGDRSSLPSLNLELYSQNLNLSYKKDFQEKWRTELGLQGSNQINNNTPGTYVTPLIPNYDSFGGGAYIIQKYSHKHAIYEAGIRYDYKYLDASGYNKQNLKYGGRFNFHNISWNLAAEIHLNKRIHFNSNLGMAWRPPQVNELFSTGLHQGTATLEIGDPSLRSENAIKWINTLNLHGEKFEMEWSAFAQYIKNYIYLNPTQTLDTSIRGVYPVFEYKQNNALFIGSDLWVAYHFTKNITYEIKGALVQAKNINLNNYFPLIPPVKLSQNLGYKIPNLGKLNQSYIEISYQYTARQTLYTANSDFAKPPPAYGLWNFQMGSKIPFGEQNIALHLGINNLFNLAYKDYMNRFRYYTDDIGRNIQIRLIYKF